METTCQELSHQKFLIAADGAKFVDGHSFDWDRFQRNSGGDFNGDGRLDIAAESGSSHQVCMLFNQGNGQFTRSFFAAGVFSGPMMAFDLNNDGKSDLILANYGFDFAPRNVNIVFHK